MILLKIYLKGGEKAETRDELLNMLYGNRTNEALILHEARLLAVATYSDPAYKYIQCEANKHRSFDDIHALLNTYFPDTDVKTTFETILSFGIQYSEDMKKRMTLQLAQCSTMSKLRAAFYFLTPPRHLEILNKGLKMSLSAYTWNQILEMSELTETTALAFRKQKLQIP